MAAEELLVRARRLSGLSQQEFARRAGTSRPTLSAYERGRKSPTLATADRIVSVAGLHLDLEPTVTFARLRTRRGRVLHVPDCLWRLPLDRAFASVVPPVHLNWSGPGRVFHLAVRGERARLYEIVLREGRPADLLEYVDGALLVDVWPDLVLPREVRDAWQPLLDVIVAGAVPGIGVAS